MTTLEAMSTTIQRTEPDPPFDEAHLSAATFLARYSGRTLSGRRSSPILMGRVGSAVFDR